MYLIESVKIGNMDRDAYEAVVTLFPAGVGRWHISVEHRSVCDRPTVAHRADADDSDYLDKYEHAKELARTWHASKRIPW